MKKGDKNLAKTKKKSPTKQKTYAKKTFPNYKGLSKTEFFNALATWANSYDKARMEQYTKALVEVIIRELRFHDEVRVPYLGTFAVQHYEAREYEVKQPDKTKKTVKVPARDLPVFIPSDTLINDINDKGITKEYKKRVRRGTTTWRDYARELRHEMWEAEEEANILQTDEAEEYVEKLHQKFRQSLAYSDKRTGEKAMEKFDANHGMKKYKEAREKKKNGEQ